MWIKILTDIWKKELERNGHAVEFKISDTCMVRIECISWFQYADILVFRCCLPYAKLL